MREVIFVVAGNHREFVNLVGWSIGGQGYRSIVSEETIRGVRGGRFIKIGTWAERNDIENILFRLRVAEFVEINSLNELREELELKTEDEKYFYRIGYKP
jgi:hypothetical protein